MQTERALSARSRDELQAFLEEDELRHITPLKMLLLYGDALNVHPIHTNDELAYVLTMPRAASHWASEHYPSVSYVVHVALRSHASDALIAAVAARILVNTGGEAFVVVTVESRLVAALQASVDPRTPLTYRLAFLTFVPNAGMTAEIRDTTTGSTRNACHSQIPHEARELLATHNIASEQELATIFADGHARCWLRYVGDEVVAVLITFANSKSLHELGSLHVRPNARRKGHAQALVQAALSDLCERGLGVRYAANATNEASIALAQKSGLRLALRSEHWVSS
jgi:ribosomal protein S18 acetylase RimI-like enzyme